MDFIGLASLRQQPKRVPAHHLKFAQPRSLGRKASDEFTVPLCRDHHQQLHRHGDEIAWWANLRIAPLKMAEELWDETQVQRSEAARRKTGTTPTAAREGLASDDD